MADHRITSNATSNTTITAAAATEPPELSEEAIVQCVTSKGPFTMNLIREWSPHAFDRAVLLFERGFYDHSHFYRVIFKFLVQFGISYTDDPELQKLASTTIPDDPQIPELRKFQVGFVSFAGNGPNTRDSQLFISLSGFFEGLGNEVWETPFGVVVEGMDETVKKLTWEYRQEPSQDRIKSEGKSYIEDHYPNLDHFETCSVKRILVTVNKTMPEHKSAVIIINRFNGGVFYTEKYGAPGKKKKKPVQKDKAASGGGRLGSTVGEHGLWVGGMALLVLFILVLARREVSHQKKQ